MPDKDLKIRIKIDSETGKLDVLNSKINNTSKGFNQADSMASTFLSRLSFGAGTVGGLYLVVDTLSRIKDRGFEVNKEFQKLTNSLTTSSAVMMANNDIYGNAITVSEKYRLASIDATRTTELLNKANLNTPHSMGETVKIYDSMYFSMRKVGATTKDMVEITEKLSIAAGNKVPFDAFLSAMDGISTGTVEANSSMGMFLRSVGLSNEEIKNSSDVVQLFKDKLSGFQAIQDFETKMSNLNNSTDMFAKNIMKIPFSWWEDQLGGIATVVDRMNDGLVRTIVSFSNVSSLSGKNDLILKRQQLLKEKDDIKNDKFMFDGEQKTKIADINKELSLLSQKMATIYQDEDKLANIGTNFDSKPIDDLVEKTLNPYGAKLDEINKKWQNNFEDMQKNGKDTSKVYAAWHKDIADLDKEESDKKDKLFKANDKLFKEQEKSAETLNKALLDISQIGLSEYDKGLISITEKTNEWIKAGVSGNDILIAKSKLLSELNSKTLFESQKEDLSFFERRIQLADDSISKELELQGISYASRILEIENNTKAINEKNKLIEKETELFNLTVQSMNYNYNTEFQDTMSNFYDDMLDSQLALNNAVYDFGSGFDGVSSKIGVVSKSIAAMSSLELTNKREASKLDKKYIEQFNKYAGDIDKTAALEKQYTIDTNILKEQGIQAQIAGYANIAGAMNGMFEQGSRDAAAFQVVESGLALVAGVRAVISQGSGDPYTAFARMAAMAATVSSLLSSIGVAFGMNKTTTSSDSFSSTTANDGSGSVLGDSKKQSESITNALSVLEDFAEPQFELLSQMNESLASINQKIGGVSSLLIQQGGFAFGEGYAGFDTGYKNNVSTHGLEKLNMFDALTGTNIMGGIINSVVGGIFGKKSVSQSLTDSGIYFADTLLTSAIKQFNGEAYQTINTTTIKKGWLSKSSSTVISSYFDALDAETNRQFSLVIDNLYNTVLIAGTALDSVKSDTENSLSNFVVSLGKISLNGKTGDQIQETLTSIFGKVGDDIAKTAFPLLSGFQKIGEGMFETLTRVATGMEEAEYFIGRLGNSFSDIIYTSLVNKQGDVGFEALLQSIEKFDEATYGANNNLVKIIDSLDSTAGELYTVYTTLDELRDRLIFLGQSSQGISSSMIYGAGSVDALSSGFSSYFENFLTTSEQLTFKTSQLNESFSKLGIQMPTTNLAFKTLLSGLDTTSASGQELYGRLITLSDSLAEISSLRVSALQDELDITNTSISNIQEISTSLDSVISSLRSGLDSSSTNLLEKFNKSLATSLLLSNADDYTALANSVKDTISYSSALNNSDYFGTLRDMQYAQATAANQFETMNLNLDTELSVLQKIADNTNNMIKALSNLTTAVTALQESTAATANNTATSRYVS